MSQRQQLERILEIDRRIRSGECPRPEDLARELEVSRRAIFNDRDFLVRRLGAPLVHDRTRGGWTYSDPTWRLPSVTVTEGELVALLLGVEVARRYVGTALEPLLTAGVGKLARGLRGPVLVDLHSLQEQVSVAAPSALSTDPMILTELHRAVRSGLRCEMRYFTASRDAHTERRVDPYHLHLASGEWYLVAWDHGRVGYRTFHAGRVEALRVTAEGFRRRHDFSPEAYVGESFRIERGERTAEVAVRFAPEAAVYIRERRWHPTQTLEELADGSCVLRLRTSGLGQVKRWVLQYGGAAQVLSPRSLRDAVAEEAALLSGRYESQSTVRRRRIRKG